MSDDEDVNHTEDIVKMMNRGLCSSHACTRSFARKLRHRRQRIVLFFWHSTLFFELGMQYSNVK